jgi:predicted negative regulator of RcsB-dependent stress response
VLEHYGDVLFETGRPDEALGYWNRALETGEGSEDLEMKINSRSIVD